MVTAGNHTGKDSWPTALKDRTGAETTLVLGQALNHVEDQMQMIPADNRRDFAAHAEVVATLDLKLNFARP